MGAEEVGERQQQSTRPSSGGATAATAAEQLQGLEQGSSAVVLARKLGSRMDGGVGNDGKKEEWIRKKK